MCKNLNETMLYKSDKNEENLKYILSVVYKALQDKGYKPTNQLIGYLLSGDPTYITSYNDARKLIRKIEKDDILEELLTFYIKENKIDRK